MTGRRPAAERGRSVRSRWSSTLAAATLAAGSVAAMLIVATAGVDVPASWGFRGASILFGLTCGAVGFMVLRTHPDHLVGWVFGAIGILFEAQAAIDAYTVLSVLGMPGALPGQPAVGWLLTWLWVPPVSLALIFLPLLFPTGHLLSPAWRPAARLGAAATILFAAANAAVPGPIQQATYLDNPIDPLALGLGGAAVVQGLAITPFGLAVGLAALSLVRRFRAAGDLERRQIKWFALSGTFAAAAFLLYVSLFVLDPGPALVKVAEILVIGTLMALPVAAGLGILRYRLYDVDRIISRSFGWALVTGSLVAVFGGTVLGLQALLADRTQGQTLAVALSTLVALALFQPLRGRVQAIVDRRFNRARYDAQLTADAFADRVRTEVDLTRLRDSLVATVGVSVRPDRAGVWLREAGPGRRGRAP